MSGMEWLPKSSFGWLLKTRREKDRGWYRRFHAEIPGSDANGADFSRISGGPRRDFCRHSWIRHVWAAYKESSWLSTCFWVILLVCFGSISTCAYIVKQLLSISGQDSSQDPLQLVLLRKDGESKVNCSSVVLGRIVFSALGIIMSAIVVYTLVTDGWPFRMELLTPWMAATLIDFYITVFAISVWVFHKESTWIRAIFWVCLLICLGSIATCAYIVIQLFKLSCQDTTYNVVKDSHRKDAKDSTSQ